MNFLQLCQDLVKELGLAGSSGPTTVVNQQGEMANVVRWVRDACKDIDNQWMDWRYLHVDYLGVIPAQSRFPLPPNTPTGVLVRRWDRDSFVLNFGSTSAKPLVFEEWSIFRKLRVLGSAGLSVDEPAVITERPDGALMVYPTADLTYPIMGEFWRRPLVLTNDEDVPLIPEEFHRLIIVTAAIKYANREDAPEIIAGMDAEYADAMEKLEADQLEGNREMRASTQDVILEGYLPGGAEH